MSKVIIDMIDLKSSVAIFNPTLYIPEGETGALLFTFTHPRFHGPSL